jgi:hypothetical protein
VDVIPHVAHGFIIEREVLSGYPDVVKWSGLANSLIVVTFYATGFGVGKEAQTIQSAATDGSPMSSTAAVGRTGPASTL